MYHINGQKCTGMGCAHAENFAETSVSDYIMSFFNKTARDYVYDHTHTHTHTLAYVGIIPM